jgi:hypothetical protein
MNAIANARSTALTTAEQRADAFAAYAASTQRTSIVGTLLKFNKGHWLAGENGEEVPANYELIAVMDELMIGWQRWEDLKPVEQVMGRVVDGFQPPRRDTLGFDEQSKWEVDNQGRPRDPWQRTNMLLLVSPKNGDVYTFSASSVGGINAIGALTGIYGKTLRQRPDDFPIVALGSDSYMHKDKTYGRIYVPALPVKGWVAKAPALAAVEAETGGGGSEPVEEEAPAREPDPPAATKPIARKARF